MSQNRSAHWPKSQWSALRAFEKNHKDTLNIISEISWLNFTAGTKANIYKASAPDVAGHMKQRADILGCVCAKMLRQQYRPVFGSIELIYVSRKKPQRCIILNPFWNVHLGRD